jgi:hypothetical protein
MILAVGKKTVFDEEFQIRFFARNKMNKLNIRLLLIAAMALGLFFLTNCGGGGSTTTTTNNGSTTTTTTNSKPADSPKTETAKTDSVGVPECDEYIKKYEACLLKIAQKAPQVEPDLKKAFQAQRDGFKQAASNPSSKAMLPNQCKQLIETAKQSYSGVYACEW